MISQHDRDRTYKFNVSIFELTRAQKVSYSLSVNLLFKDFDYTIRKVSYNSKMNDLSNKSSNLVETTKDIWVLRNLMLYSIYLAV